MEVIQVLFILQNLVYGRFYICMCFFIIFGVSEMPMLFVVYCIQIQIPVFNLDNHNTTTSTHYNNIRTVAIKKRIKVYFKTIVKCRFKEMQQMPLAGRWQSVKRPDFFYWRNKCSHNKKQVKSISANLQKYSRAESYLSEFHKVSQANESILCQIATPFVRARGDRARTGVLPERGW